MVLGIRPLPPAFLCSLTRPLDVVRFNVPVGGIGLWMEAVGDTDIDAWAAGPGSRAVIVTARGLAVDGRPRPFTRLRFASLNCEELAEGVRRLAAARRGWSTRLFLEQLLHHAIIMRMTGARRSCLDFSPSQRRYDVRAGQTPERAVSDPADTLPALCVANRREPVDTRATRRPRAGADPSALPRAVPSIS
jgi:hypothetical protein